MNRLIYAATIAIAIVISAVGARAWTLFTTDKLVRAAPGVPLQLEQPAGRYVIYQSPLAARFTFLVDTVTGKVWQLTSFSDLAGQPTVWDYMERIDNLQQLSAFAAATGPAKPVRKTK